MFSKNLFVLALGTLLASGELINMPESISLWENLCPTVTGSRFNQVRLYDESKNMLAVAAGSCNIAGIGAGCALEGFSNITIDNYVVSHPNAIFGSCAYENPNITVT
jgi:hypothetical protein